MSPGCSGPLPSPLFFSKQKTAYEILTSLEFRRVLFRSQRRLQVAHDRGAGPPQHIPLAPLAQLPAKPRVAAQRIVTRHPAVRNVLTPLVKPLQALLGSRVIPHLLWHRARLASWLVSCPLLREGQAEVEHGMLVAGDVSHEDTHLAVVDLSPVPAPLALDPDRVRAPLRKAAGIEGDDAIGFTRLSVHFGDQHRDQRPMIPGRRPNEVLDELSLHIDQGGDCLSILTL